MRVSLGESRIFSYTLADDVWSQWPYIFWMLLWRQHKIVCQFHWFIKMQRPLSDVISSRELLSVIITAIVDNRAPINAKLDLIRSVLQPVKTHVNCLGSLLFEIFIHKTNSSSAINLHRSRRLRMIKKFQNLPQRKNFFCIFEGRRNFCLSGRVYDVLQRVAENMNGSIWFGFR